MLKKARNFFFVWTFWGLGEVGKKKEKKIKEEEEEENTTVPSKKKRRRRRKKKTCHDDDERVKKEMIAGSSFPRNSAGANANGEDGRTKKEHAPHSGACSTWVDDEIEAMQRSYETSCRDRRVAKRRSRAERGVKAD